MIEVRIDFDEIDKIRELNYAYGNRIPENIKKKDAIFFIAKIKFTSNS